MSSKENIKSKTISDIIKNWFLNSPSNGIRRIGRAKTLIARIVFGYIFWIFTILMVCFIYIVFINYIAHPTKIRLSVSQYRDPKHFPAITFCNINPLKNDGFLNDVRKSRLPGSQSSSPLTETEYRKAVSAYIERILSAHVSGQRHPFVEWGFKLNDLMITCIYNKRLCSRNLAEFFHPNYGNCYTFDNEKHILLEANNTNNHHWSVNDDNGNENYNLFLELYLHQKEYNEFLEDRAGFRIFIHRKNEIPILSQSNLFVGPNKYTKLTFLPRIMSLSQQCEKNLPDHMKELFLTQEVRYTQALCYKVCKHRFIVKNCQCIEPTSAIFYQFFNNNPTIKNISLCSMNNRCPSIISNNFNSSKLCPECLPECEIIQYTVYSSYAHYPNTKSFAKVLRRVQNHFRFDRNMDSDLNISNNSPSNHRKGLRDNIVAVEISASSYVTEILTESRVYTWVDLISSIGGQTGLWIGVSLISIVEIIELLYLLIKHFFSYIFFCKKTSNFQE